MNKKLKKLGNILLTTVISLSILTPLMVSADECDVNYHYLFIQGVGTKSNGTTSRTDGAIGDSSNSYGTASGLSYSDRRVLFSTPSRDFFYNQITYGDDNWSDISDNRFIAAFSRILEKAATSSSAVDLSNNTGTIYMETSCAKYGSDYYCINDGSFDSTSGHQGIGELTKVMYQMYYYINNSNDSTCVSNTRSALNILKSELANSIVNDEVNYTINLNDEIDLEKNPFYNTTRRKFGFSVVKTWDSDYLFDYYLTQTDVTDDNEQFVARKGINLFKYKYNMSKSCNNGYEVFDVSQREIDSDGSFRTFNDVGTYPGSDGETYSKYVAYMVSDYTANFNLSTCYDDIAIDQYRLIYDANGGVDEPPSRYISSDSSTFTLSSDIPTREGYTFLGWATSSSATTKKYDPSQTLQTSILANTSDGELTLYAVWQANPVDDDNNSVVDPDSGSSSENNTPMNKYGAGVGLGIIALSLVGGTAGVIYVNKSGKFSKI